MDVKSVCTSLLAESDAQNKTISAPNVASVTDADKVINIKLGSAQVEGDCLSSDSGGRRDEELLKGLLTDDYCHVCEAVLLFESQRLSHYEGKKHSQKLRVYLQAKRAEEMHRHPSTSRQQTMTTDKDRFCELCNMVFSSPVVARSHYEGKVHSKNLGKKGLQPKDRYTESSATQDSDNAEQKSVGNNNTEPLLDPTVGTATPNKEVNLKDPNKHCALCAASFNNPQMALQHYNGRKHQRRQARQELLQDLGDDVQQENSLMCSMCSLQFNSVEMYQAHMQGNKHQTKEKKVVDLCSSQQKAYSTFADELSDYIQVQRARGITPKNSEVLTTADKRQKDEEDEHDQVFNKGDISEVDKSFPNLPPSSNLPHHSRLGCYNPGERRRPPYQGSFWPSDGWHYNDPPPVFPGPGSALISSMPIKRRRHRKHSSSSSYDSSSSYSSSYSSSDSSSTSDSDDSEYKHREKRRMRNSRRERDRRAQDKDSDKAEKMRKRRRKDKGKESVERKRRESGDVKEERIKRKMKGSGKWGRQEKKSPEENVKEGEEGGRVMDKLMPEDVNYNGNEGEVHMNVEEGDGGQFEQAKPKYRKEKKKTKEKVDSRTEDEKLWDDSILGC